MNAHVWGVLFLLVLPVYISSCAVIEVDPNDPNAHLIKDLEHVRQGEMQCGPTTLTMVLRYYKVDVSLGEIDRKVRPKASKGTSCSSMKQYPVANHDFGMRSFNASNPNILKNFIVKDFPLIVRGKSEGSGPAECHYVVIVGYNKEGFIINDPLSGLRFKSYQSFKNWHTCKYCGHYWTLAIYPRNYSADIPSPYFE